MWERNIDWLPFVRTLTGDQICNLGMCPDRELNLWPFGLQEDVQPSEPHTSQGNLISFYRRDSEGAFQVCPGEMVWRGKYLIFCNETRGETEDLLSPGTSAHSLFHNCKLSVMILKTVLTFLLDHLPRCHYLLLLFTKFTCGLSHCNGDVSLLKPLGVRSAQYSLHGLHNPTWATSCSVPGLLISSVKKVQTIPAFFTSPWFNSLYIY